MCSNSCSHGTAMKSPSRIGDRSTSDVVARLRTPDGRDEWIYCHSHILIEKSKYFADRLSESWPTCQILDSRNCVEVYCHEHDFDYHITVLRILYFSKGCSVTDMWHGVKNALGILQVAVELGCPEIVSTCVDYLEASPWEEADEEEILKIIPGMGLLAEPILARLQPVNSTAIVKIFLSATLFVTSSLPQTMVDLKTSVQEQIEYMLTEDDDAPLLTADEEVKSKVRLYFNGLLTRFNSIMNSACETGETHPFQCFLVDMSWACQILTKMEILRDFVENWTDASENMVKCVEQISQQDEMLETKLKVVEVTCKVLEAIGYGSVILPTAKRLHMIKIWLPFVRHLKDSVDSLTTDNNDCSIIKLDGEIWQALESAFVLIILALPSGEQAEIVSEWLENKCIRYPDLTEVFEVWCYRSKVANSRLANIRASNGMMKML